MKVKKILKNTVKVISIVGGAAAAGFGAYTLLTGGNKTLGAICTAGGAAALSGGITGTTIDAVKSKKAKKEVAVDQDGNPVEAEVVEEATKAEEQK
jgi:outer membrane lipoprotein SlyB